MKTSILVVLLLVGGLASAQPSGSDQAAPVLVPPPAPAPAPAPTGGRSAAELHQICADAMNADPAFAKSIVVTVDKQIDKQTIDAHDAAIKSIAAKESHVIYAYAALWVIIALLVAFMWLRQQKLKVEIEALRRDLAKAEA